MKAEFGVLVQVAAPSGNLWCNFGGQRSNIVGFHGRGPSSYVPSTVIMMALPGDDIIQMIP
jgi:hypothetical protein